MKLSLRNRARFDPPAPIKRLNIARNSKQSNETTDGHAAKRSRSTRESLDLLLSQGSTTDDKETEISERPTISWWERPISSRQVKPARRTRLSQTDGYKSSSTGARDGIEEGRGEGRFMANEDVFGSQLAGEATRLDEPLKVPRSSFSIASYSIACLSLTLHTTYFNLSFVKGDVAAARFLSSLTLVDLHLNDDGGATPLIELLLRGISSLLITSSPIVFVASQACLFLIAVEVEALMGPASFVALFTIAGIVSQILLLSILDQLFPGHGSMMLGPIGLIVGYSGCLGALIQISNGPIAAAKRDKDAMTRNKVPSPSHSHSPPRYIDGFSLSLLTSTLPLLVSYSLLLASPRITSLIFTQPAEPPVSDLQLPLVLLGALLGLSCGWAMSSFIGPQYQVSREPDIPDGSMTVPLSQFKDLSDRGDSGGANDLIVVVNTRSQGSLVITSIGFGFALFAYSSLVH